VEVGAAAKRQSVTSRSEIEMMEADFMDRKAPSGAKALF
jgi:hypothetical protein